MGNVRWTKQEDQELINAHDQGLMFKDIAEKVSFLNIRSSNACSQRALKLKKKKVEEKNWSDTEETRLLNFKNSGLTFEKIASKLKRTFGSCKSKFYKNKDKKKSE